MAEGSGEMKAAFSALPWNAAELKGPRNEGGGPGDFGFNTDAWGRWELRHPNVQRDGAHLLSKTLAKGQTLQEAGEGSVWVGCTGV